jgi:hypothetical protein
MDRDAAAPNPPQGNAEHVKAGDATTTPEPAPSTPAAPPAAEMPQTAAIPDERRKSRLLDRITGLGKA